MELFNHEYFILEENDTNVFINVLKAGFSMKAFNECMKEVPRLKLTKFGAAKEAVENPTGTPVLIGRLRDEIEVSVSSDEMKAYVVVNMTKAQYEAKRSSVPSMIVKALKEVDVCEGILKDALDNVALVDKTLVAEGVKPIPGKDAVISYFEISEKKPVMSNDGKVNHYELDLIDNVKKGDWLGKRLHPTKGVEGVTVKGNQVTPKAGRDFKLKFEQQSVVLKSFEDYDEIYAAIDGAVVIKNGRISVDNHLIIEGDVEYTTGNIDFDGYVTVTGTVKDNFMVKATYDIAINGQMGIGASGLIESVKGSVLVKGGINGKGVAQVVAHKDVYTKYANETKITAGNAINIGVYAIDSELNAKKIIISSDGRLIGGHTHAGHRIEAGSIGNKSEKPTRIYVDGFERSDTLDLLNFYREKVEDLMKQGNRIKRELDILERNYKRLDEKGLTTYDFIMIKFDDLNSNIKELESKISELEDILRTKGEGEVAISNSVFPKTLLEIKKLQKRIKDTMHGSFYVKDKTMHHH